MKKDKQCGASLPDRMKRYERAAQGCLVRRMPAIIRVDGKAFHTFTRGMDKPFSTVMRYAMTAAAEALMQEAQGAQLAYVQSDEISVLLVDFQTIATEAWFDYEIQKMASVSASVATVAFNNQIGSPPARALFDSRCFNVPEDDVCNYFVWRQRDAIRNSIQGFAQSKFPHKSMHGLSCDALQEKMFTEAGFNWNDVPAWQRRGWAVRRVAVEYDGIERRSRIVADYEAPEFSKARGYIEGFMERREE